MATKAMPNERFILRGIRNAIAAIDVDTYYCKVAQTVIADYPPDSPQRFVGDTPSAHIWAMESQLSEGQNGAPERDLIVWIAGVVKVNEELQERMIEFAASVRSVMLFALAGTFSGDLRVFVLEDEEGVSYMIENLDGGGFAGSFLSKWRVTYAFPSPIG